MRLESGSSSVALPLARSLHPQLQRGKSSSPPTPRARAPPSLPPSVPTVITLFRPREQGAPPPAWLPLSPPPPLLPLPSPSSSSSSSSSSFVGAMSGRSGRTREEEALRRRRRRRSFALMLLLFRLFFVADVGRKERGGKKIAQTEAPPPPPSAVFDKDGDRYARQKRKGKGRRGK